MSPELGQDRKSEKANLLHRKLLIEPRGDKIVGLGHWLRADV